MSDHDADDTPTNRRQFHRTASAAPLIGTTHAAPAISEFVRLFQPADWQADAACKGLPTEWWYPERGDVTPKAKAICNDCPVQTECREYAIDEQHGIWAGQNAKTRRANRRANGKPPPRRPGAHTGNRNAAGQRPDTWKPIAHGTRRGYKAERYHGLPVCEECRTAWNAYKRELKDRKTAA